ncbi:ASCH domain-containing protein [Streptomyces olivaceus]|uniref:ASCH domain-containing protein n=1 Tax=Streptomyces olivaceus TaxID=47716 RepID=UPI0036863812
MKALTIRQPWAGAIAHGTKRVENRTWKLPAKYEGARILIHAGAQPDRHAQVYGEHLDVYSAIVAVATITGCHYDNGNQVCCSYWAQPGLYHWTLADVTALPEPVPAKGALGFWTADDDVLAAIQAQLADTATAI